MSKKIQKHLDLVPIVDKVRTSSDMAEDDFELARENIRSLMGEIKGSLDDLKGVAKQSQHPRAYEVLDKMYRTAIDANMDLLDIRKKNEEIKEKQGRVPDELKNETHNHLHITTAELAKMLENQNKPEADKDK
jgi:hypothetical protein